MNYTEFCRQADTPLTEEERRSEEITDATNQELQWRKGYEVRRAVRHHSAGNPTVPDLQLVSEKAGIAVGKRKYRKALAKET